MELTSFLLYGEQLEQLAALDMEQRGLLLTVLMEAACGNVPAQEQMDPVVRVAFAFIWAQVQRDKKKFAETSAARSAALRRPRRKHDPSSEGWRLRERPRMLPSCSWRYL